MIDLADIAEFTNDYPQDIDRLVKSANRFLVERCDRILITVAYHQWCEETYDASWLSLPESENDLDKIMWSVLGFYRDWQEKIKMLLNKFNS